MTPFLSEPFIVTLVYIGNFKIKAVSENLIGSPLNIIVYKHMFGNTFLKERFFYFLPGTVKKKRNSEYSINRIKGIWGSTMNCSICDKSSQMGYSMEFIMGVRLKGEGCGNRSRTYYGNFSPLNVWFCSQCISERLQYQKKLIYVLIFVIIILLPVVLIFFPAVILLFIAVINLILSIKIYRERDFKSMFYNEIMNIVEVEGYEMFWTLEEFEKIKHK